LLECKSMAPYNFISSPPLSGLGLAYSANRTASRRSRLDDYQVCTTSPFAKDDVKNKEVSRPKEAKKICNSPSVTNLG
jgi:hypothetical protein